MWKYDKKSTGKCPKVDIDKLPVTMLLDGLGGNLKCLKGVDVT